MQLIFSYNVLRPLEKSRAMPTKAMHVAEVLSAARNIFFATNVCHEQILLFVKCFQMRRLPLKL
jgi:hypothetical protein